MQSTTDAPNTLPLPAATAVDTLRTPLDNVISMGDWLAGQLPWRRRVASAVRRRIFEDAA